MVSLPKSDPELHFTASGAGDIAIICIHGWGCEGGQFAGLAQDLSRDFRVFCPDLPGHGQTPLGALVPGWKDYAEVIAAFAERRALRSPVLLGHSMGGLLSLVAAAATGIKPRAVINLDGGLPAAEKTLAGQRLIRSWLAQSDFQERFARMSREVLFLPAERDAQCDAIVRTMCAAPEPVLRFLPERMEELDARQILPKINCPVLYVGSAAPRFDPAQARAILPGLRCEQIPGAGHFLQVYAEREVSAMVRNFLDLGPR